MIVIDLNAPEDGNFPNSQLLLYLLQTHWLECLKKEEELQLSLLRC